MCQAYFENFTCINSLYCILCLEYSFIDKSLGNLQDNVVFIKNQANYQGCSGQKLPNIHGTDLPRDKVGLFHGQEMADHD